MLDAGGEVCGDRPDGCRVCCAAFGQVFAFADDDYARVCGEFFEDGLVAVVVRGVVCLGCFD